MRLPPRKTYKIHRGKTSRKNNAELKKKTIIGVLTPVKGIVQSGKVRSNILQLWQQNISATPFDFIICGQNDSIINQYLSVAAES